MTAEVSRRQFEVLYFLIAVYDSRCLIKTTKKKLFAPYKTITMKLDLGSETKKENSKASHTIGEAIEP